MCVPKKGTGIDTRFTCFGRQFANFRSFNTEYHFRFIFNRFSDV